LTSQTYKATQELSGNTYEHLGKPNIQSYTCTVRNYIRKAWTNQTYKATHGLSEPTYEKLDKPDIQSHTGTVRTYIRKACPTKHTKPHRNCQNLHTNTLQKQTYKATHELSGPTYGKLDKQTYKATQELPEPTHEHIDKTSIQSHTGTVRTYIRKA
jgi:hypothetical protein